MRNRHKFYFITVAILIGCTLPSMAQSQQDVRPSQLVLTAKLSGPDGVLFKPESELPNAPSAAQQDAGNQAPQAQPSAPAAHTSKRYSQGAPAAAMGGPLGMEGRTADKKFWGVTGAMFGASIADAELTQRCQEYKKCSYVPPSLRSRTMMYGIGIPADIGVMYLTYHLKRRHSSIWYVPSALVTAANMYVAIHAYHRAKE